MALHIGIVACSSEGASLCYRTICAEGSAILGGHAHPEISMHTHSLADYVNCLERGDLEGVGALMLSSARKLAGSGADFLICPDNTIHQAFGFVETQSPLPWMHIADVVALAARDRGFKTLGLTGTRWLVESEVYPEKLAALGLQCIRPPERDVETMNRIIMEELVLGIFTPESTASFLRIIDGLKDLGCDAAILGCTEIPLIINEDVSPLPKLDSTRLLARAALRRAIEGS